MIEYENLARLNSNFILQYEKFFSNFLEKGWFILGESVDLFEKNFARYCGAKHCVGVASGLDALVLSLLTLDIPKGSEVLVPSNTYIASILAIVEAGLVPILVEPNVLTYNIDPSLLESKLTSKTKVVLVVHLYGKSCEMSSIVQFCNEHSLYLVEDCAQSHGAKYKDQMTGTFGDLGAFSFYPTKNLGALGDAGAIVTNNPDLAEKLKALRNYGSHEKYYNRYIGKNSRLDEIQAGFLNIKLKYLDEINQHKRKLAEIYYTELDDNIIKPVRNDDFFDVFHIYPIRIERRDELKKYLFDRGVKTEIHYPVAPNAQECMKEILSGSFPISEEIHNSILSLPISYIHSSEDIFEICARINEFQKL